MTQLSSDFGVGISAFSQAIPSPVTTVIHQPEVPPLFGTYFTNKVNSERG